VSLQTSAHILQNLLLWWNFSATPRGCAFFCASDAAAQHINGNQQRMLYVPSIEAVSKLNSPGKGRRLEQRVAVRITMFVTAPWARHRFGQNRVLQREALRVLWYTRLAVKTWQKMWQKAAQFPESVSSARGSCAEFIFDHPPITTCMRHSPKLRIAQSRVY
jgi:hypothetical protein